ncbi:DUF4194 domain-containing protein [Halopseudomonas formosensis]|uniref:DUF4194 domain-containing protein n=1 Tax=Halopseudomonas formosensis TaxID=1002526 RepID=A0A1I5ZIW2_9GAMM|nr:DUF4194 domain-containing protein [Halopseudomonas formosensis]MDX9688063.1 DUF4194 domain-containing protein [Halopseudomonas formosensis]SFQ56422.1 protein of unknown function [Halopseudomonas formosensis]
MSDTLANDLSPLLISLLKGVLYREDDPPLWQSLTDQQVAVRDYIQVLGLELILDEAEGYAYLRQRQEDGDNDRGSLPRLIPRRQLSYPVSLLLALLRKRLAEFDASSGDARLILSRDQLVELLRLFLPEGTNEARLIDRIDSHISRVVELGFLRRLRGQQEPLYEVRRILKAFIDAQWLNEFDQRLAEYASQLGDGGEAR